MQPELELMKITQKLQDRCGCFDCDDGATMQRYMESFLRVLARLFCWTDGECDTILRARRHEVIEVKDFDICGCDAMVEIKPYYFKGFDPSTLKVYMHKRKGLEREEYEITPDKYNWSFVDGTILINVTEELSPCCRCCDPCSCETEYKIILDYEAGYTSASLPDCIFEAMCHFMNIFVAYQNNCGTLDECANMDRLAVGAVLEQKSVDYIVRKWTVDKTSLETVYVKLINTWALKTLSSLSLCKKVYTENMYLAIGRRKECK
jgi:hypothetical protein|nr:MAG TPA: hypothetical protein [Caudoviricetes sp.]